MSYLLTINSPEEFREIIWHYYFENRRFFSWRENISTYRVVVSEVMLQQTQTHRVAKKFDEFIAEFDSFSALAEAPFSEVLRSWKGLGYNRRALNLRSLAQIIVQEHKNELPSTIKSLEALPGIGKATARSIYSFAFDLPCAFIETNIRTVYIHFFFKNRLDVHDREILALVENTLPTHDFRNWYYALMDYGAMLKKTVGNLNASSVHYKKQSRFEGSSRQLRGRILDHLLRDGRLNKEKLLEHFSTDATRAESMLQQLCGEGLVKHERNFYFL